MQKYGLILLTILIGTGIVVMAQDDTPTPPRGPVPIVTAETTEVTDLEPTSTPELAASATPTFAPANGESAQIIGPLSVIDNAHAAVSPFTSVSENPTLSGETLPIKVNGRLIEVPHAWSYTGEPGIGGLPPHMLRYDGQGIRFGWDYVNGQAGFAQDAIQLFGNQRYVVRVTYETDLIYDFDNTPYDASHYQVGARIYTARGGFTELPLQSMRGTMEDHVQEWVIESTTNPYPFVRLEVFFDMEFPIFIGGVYLESIDVLTVPADYRPEFVINFE